MISSRNDYRESKAVQNRGDSMTDSMNTTASKTIRPSRVPAFIAMLFGAIFTILLLPAYGQQEVDPTWYDPWAAPSTAAVPVVQPSAVVHSAQPVAAHPHQQTVRSVSPAPDAAKFRAKDTQLNQSRHNAAGKSGGTPSADNRLPGAVRLSGFETRRAETQPAEIRNAASVARGGVRQGALRRGPVNS